MWGSVSNAPEEGFTSIFSVRVRRVGEGDEVFSLCRQFIGVRHIALNMFRS